MKKIKKFGVLFCAFAIMFLIFPVTGCSHGGSGSGSTRGVHVVEKSLSGMISYINSINATGYYNPESIRGTYHFKITDSGEDEEAIAKKLLTLGDAIISFNSYPNAVVELDLSDLNITELPKGTFSFCDKITSVILPDSLEEIGDCAFYGCHELTSITIPSKVTCIGELAFSNCTSMTSVILPDSLIEIGDSAFLICESLTSITIPKNVTYIGELAFYYCTSLVQVTFSEKSSLQEIGERAFESCESLISITFPDSNNSIKIGELAFNCSSLKFVETSSSVTEIGDRTFERCTSLTSVFLSKSLIKIGDSAFNECSSLTSVIFEDPTGWKNENNEEISEDKLNDPSTAAKYITADLSALIKSN